jgi:large subunit ribosomal protein L25
MEIVKLEVVTRTEFGKGPSSRLRREGQIPAVAYGKNLPAANIAVSPKALMAVLNSDHGRNSVVELSLSKEKTITALVTEYSYHPVTRSLIHADFLEISLEEPVEVIVPFETYGKSKGVTEGGTLRLVRRVLPIRCLPQQIPVRIRHDITNLGLAEAVKVSQLTLPEGVSVVLPPEQTLAMVDAPNRAKEEEEEGKEPAAAAGKKK